VKSDLKFNVKLSGFTLIELLVVLVIVGLLMSVAVMNMGGNQLSRKLDNQVSELYFLLRTASDNAVILNTEIGVDISNEKYGFVTYNEKQQQWQAYIDSKLKTENLPNWISINFTREGKEIKLPIASQNQNQSTQSSNAQTVEPPKIVLLSSGEVTPFKLVIKIAGTEEPVYIIRSDGIHPMTLQRPGDDIP
jgi:general secretion pathway protein H